MAPSPHCVRLQSLRASPSGGHLSGPFARVDADQLAAAIMSLLELRDDISLPDPRATAPEMARLAGRHPRLNLMNLEAVAPDTSSVPRCGGHASPPRAYSLASSTTSAFVGARSRSSEPSYRHRPGVRGVVAKLLTGTFEGTGMEDPLRSPANGRGHGCRGRRRARTW